ncbi:four helix bundle protein [Candidatus Falkowbacteria bacterium]|nr:four helix bundle protein [Candidatus Falkowbacteria bacterium]
MGTKSFKELIVWQKSRDLAIAVYQFTEKFPRSELYGLSSQMRRAAVSISSNIAESYRRFHFKEKRHLLTIAFGSGSELESQIEISKILFSNIDYDRAERTLDEVMKLLNNFLNNNK